MTSEEDITDYQSDNHKDPNEQNQKIQINYLDTTETIQFLDQPGKVDFSRQKSQIQTKTILLKKKERIQSKNQVTQLAKLFQKTDHN